MIDDEREWISLAEAADRLDLNKRAVKRWIRSGRLQSRASADGRMVVSRQDVESLREELFAAAVTAEPETISPSPSFDESPRRRSKGQDPIRALQQQADRSIQIAGAAFHEARQLAAAYREELHTARKEHREELRRARRAGRTAWTLATAALLAAAGGAWFVGRQFGDRRVHEIRASHLRERLEAARAENEQLQKQLQTLRDASEKTASELRQARLTQADAVGQLAAFRAHAEQLTRQIARLESQLRQEREAHALALQDARRQAAEAERNRLARIRQAKAEQAELARRKMEAQARAQREALREQEQRLQAQREENETLPPPPVSRTAATTEPLAQVDHRVGISPRPVNPADLTLTELEEALTPKR